MMELKSFTVSLEKNPGIAMRVIPGHFTTSNSHISHYLDVGSLKSDALIARDVARELAVPYLASTFVETIICMERTEVIGAYLAEELMQSGVSAVNGNDAIHVITPMSNTLGYLFFQSSMIKHIVNRNILLLTAYVSSGRSIDSMLDCISYYHGKAIGISALFAVAQDNVENEINALFTSDDIPDYKVYSSRKCEMCRNEIKLDAIISSEGYTKI